MFELESDEREYLLEVLRAAHTDLLHGLHHTDTRDYEEKLKQQIAMNERLTAKLSKVAA